MTSNERVFQFYSVPPVWSRFCPVYVYEQYSDSLLLSPPKVKELGPAHKDNIKDLVGLHIIKANCAQFLVVKDLHKVSPLVFIAHPIYLVPKLAF
jgi:hypothetical protein